MAELPAGSLPILVSLPEFGLLAAPRVDQHQHRLQVLLVEPELVGVGLGAQEQDVDQLADRLEVTGELRRLHRHLPADPEVVPREPARLQRLRQKAVLPLADRFAVDPPVLRVFRDRAFI